MSVGFIVVVFCFAISLLCVLIAGVLAIKAPRMADEFLAAAIVAGFAGLLSAAAIWLSTK